MLRTSAIRRLSFTASPIRQTTGAMLALRLAALRRRYQTNKKNKGLSR
jgi:hypothetical protein